MTKDAEPLRFHKVLMSVGGLAVAIYFLLNSNTDAWCLCRRSNPLGKGVPRRDAATSEIVADVVRKRGGDRTITRCRGFVFAVF